LLIACCTTCDSLIARTRPASEISPWSGSRSVDERSDSTRRPARYSSATGVHARRIASTLRSSYVVIRRGS
jgi:hypothetical protein